MGLNLLLAAGSAIAAALRFIGGILYQPDTEERTSVWSVRRRDAQLFFTMTFVFWTLAAALLAYVQYGPDAPEILYRMAPPLPPGATPTVYNLVERFGGIVIGLAAAAMLLTPTLTVSGRCLMGIARFINEKLLVPRVNKMVESHLNRRLAEARAESIAETQAIVHNQIRDEGRAEGHAVGHAVASAEANRRWRQWLERHDAALARGEPFDEPAPDQAGPPRR